MLGMTLALPLQAGAQIKAQVPAATPPWTSGIQPISRDSYYNAMECGKQGGTNPPCVFWDTGLCKNDDFTIAMYTPYKQVAYEVWLAVSNKRPAPTPNYAAAQKTRVVVGISPVRGSKNPITGVVVKRGGRIVKPATQTLDPGRSTFIFDFAVFAPTSGITLDLVGKEKTISCVVDRAVLARFR